MGVEELSGLPSRKSAEIGRNRPFSAFFGLFWRPGKARKKRTKAFFLRYPRICLNLNAHLLIPHLRHLSVPNVMCKWTRPFWGADCQRSPESLSSAQAASLCSAGIERTAKCLQGEQFLRCCHSTHSLLFRVFVGVAGGGGFQQQFATQTLRVHLLGIHGSTQGKKKAHNHQEFSGMFLMCSFGVIPYPGTIRRKFCLCAHVFVVVVVVVVVAAAAAAAAAAAVVVVVVVVVVGVFVSFAPKPFASPETCSRRAKCWWILHGGVSQIVPFCPRLFSFIRLGSGTGTNRDTSM